MKKNYIKGFSILFLIFSISIVSAQEYRTIDGSNNNLSHPSWGAANTPLLRATSNGYTDRISIPAGLNRPNPRTISNDLFSQVGFLSDDRGLSDFTWVFGQFIDHDVTFVLDGDESIPINVPAGDPHFDPFGTGRVQIGLHRSQVAEGTGTSSQNPRNHTNAITAFVDASAVYGSNLEQANWLRSFSGGKMKISHGNMLPFNTLSGEFDSPIDPNAPHMDDAVGLSEKIFVAGDARANENPLLLSYHTLFVREHNRICDELIQQYPNWTDEQLYQYARKIVGGLLQSIVYNEWLPTMGVYLPSYEKYDPTLQPGITNVFSAAAFRVGHTLLNGTLLRLDKEGNTLPEGNVELRSAFFNPMLVIESGIEPFLQGMAAQIQQSMDAKVIDDVRNFLFGPPGAGGMDLAAINIQRGRERGLADYNTIRQNIGLRPYQRFSQINNDPDVFNSLQATYGDINDIDPWVGMLAEAPMENSLFGETILRAMQIQFAILRNADRFYFENDSYLPAELKKEIRETKMVDIIKRNTDISIMQKNVFKADIPENSCVGLDIQGTVSTEKGLTIGDVNIQLEALFENQEYLSTSTDDGTFAFNNVSACNEYDVNPSIVADDWTNGLTTYDMSLLLDHITGEQILDSPYKIIAADVDGSGSLTIADIIEMRSVLLGKKTTFAVGQVWRFVDATYDFQNSSNPLGEDFEAMKFEGNQERIDIVAVKMGDLDASVAVKGRSANWEDIQSTDFLKVRQTTIGRNYQIELYFERDIKLKGFQFELNYDKEQLSLLRLRTGRLPQLTNNNFEYDNRLRNLKASWVQMGTNIRAGEAIATLTFAANSSNIDVCNSLSFVSTSLSAELYDETGIHKMELDCEGSAANNTNTAQLYENNPNPFDESTQIRFDLPKSMNASIVLLSSQGEVLHTIRQGFEAGENEVTIYRSMLGNIRGGIFYRLEAEGVSLVRKMIME